MGFLRRVVFVFTFPAAVFAVLAAFALPAGAIDVEGPCQATIQFDGVGEKVVLKPSQATQSGPIGNDQITIPDGAQSVHYTGETTDGPSNDFVGEAVLKLGPIKLNVFSWSSANSKNETSASGVFDLPSIMDDLPGVYEVEATHRDKVRACRLKARLERKGSLTSSPIGLASLGGTVLFGGMMLKAGISTSRSNIRQKAGISTSRSNIRQKAGVSTSRSNVRTKQADIDPDLEPDAEPVGRLRDIRPDLEPDAEPVGRLRDIRPDLEPDERLVGGPDVEPDGVSDMAKLKAKEKGRQHVLPPDLDPDRHIKQEPDLDSDISDLKTKPKPAPRPIERPRPDMEPDL